MKKIFTLLLNLFMIGALSANAQTWNFANGLSDATKTNLAADAANWTTNRTNSEGVVTGWKNAVKTSGALTANGQTITELDGLTFTSLAAGHLLLDPASIRLGGASEGITFKGVKNGQTITFKAKSANSSATNRALVCTNAEGVTYTSGPADGICYGSAVDASAYPDVALGEAGVFTLIWTVTTEDENGIDVTISTGDGKPNGGGIDIQSIKVSGGNAEEDKNIAWVSTDGSNDMYTAMRPTTGFAFTDIPASAEITADSLRTYDAVVISADVTADSPMAKLLEENIAFMPMVNLNTNLFGYTPASTANTTLTIKKEDNSLFADVSKDENNQFNYVNVAVALPERFAADDTLAVNGDAVAFHQHNANRNTYILVASDAEYNAVSTDSWSLLVGNAISMAVATKRAVIAASKPTITESHTDGTTTATITCGTASSQIMYSIGDGEYKVYTEPIVFTDSLVLNAYATAEGYTQSGTASQKISILHQAAKPVIAVATENGKATVTITGEEGATVYYNFRAASDKKQCGTYSEPVVVSENCTITAFAEMDGKLASDAVAEEIIIPGYAPMKNTLSHFDANKAQYSNGESKAYYYCYMHDASKKNYSITDNYTCVYTPEGADWSVVTSGQQVVWESTSPQHNVADFSNYNPATAFDDIDNEITTGEITIGTTGSTTIQVTEDSTATVKDAPSAAIVSTKKFQAPFDVVVYNGGKGDNVAAIYVSTDSINWTMVGDSISNTDLTDPANKNRIWKRSVVNYKGTDQVYVKLASTSSTTIRVFDIFVKGEGEDPSGIQNITTAEEKADAVRKFVRNGQILIKTPYGTFNTVGAKIE